MSARGNLRYANRAGLIASLGRVAFIGGQSNANTAGNNTGQLSLQGSYSKPAAATLYINGVLQAGYAATNFGVEVGFIDEVINVWERPSVTVFRYGVDGTSAASWNTTHAATAIGHASAVGARPVAFGYIQGENEAGAGSSQASGWSDDIENVLGRLRSAWGGGLAVCLARIRTTDAVNYPHHAIVRTEQDLVASTFPHMGIYNVDDMPLATDGSGTVHYTGATAIESGRRMARVFLAAGIL